MTTQANNSISSNYDSGDMLEISEMAQEQLSDIFVLLSSAQKELKETTDYLSQCYGIPALHLDSLKRLISITGVMANEGKDYYIGMSKKYEKEWEASKQKAVA